MYLLGQVVKDRVRLGSKQEELYC